jgi:hypothetical protein
MSADTEETTETIDDIDAEADGTETPDQPDGADEADIGDGIADVPDALADDIESDAGLSDDETDTTDTDTTETDTSSDTKHDTYGDLYAKTLVRVTNAAIESHGKPDAEKVDIEATRQLDIPHHADRLAEEIGIGENMPPGQALVASSTLFVLMNVASKTDLPQTMLEDMDGLPFGGDDSE